MYQALYRKYRPRTFDEVSGQEHITETLKNQVMTGRLSHAYLFIGTRGTGKTTCAKILAKAANCEHPVNGNPCNACAACRGIDDGSVLDVVEIDAASNNSVDNVRALRDEAVFSPASVKKRVYIIDEVHMLSTAAFNALLKILEEPPEHLMFILATTELRKVPATILSRCQRYSFRRIAAPVLSRRLDYIAEKEGLRLTPDASALLSRLADGSFRDGISLLDQCSGAPVINTETVLSAMGLAGNRRVAELLRAVADRDAAGALTLFSDLWRDGKDPAGLLSDLSVLMRDLLVLSVAPKNGGELLSGGCDDETLRALSGRFTDAELLRDLQRTQEALASMRDNPSPRTAAELCLVSLCDPTLTDGLPELRARLSRLEETGVPARGPAPAAAAAGPEKRTPEPEPGPESEPESGPESEPAGADPCGDEDADGDGEAPQDDPGISPEEPADEAPAEAKSAPDETPAPGGELSWEALCAAVKDRLPIGLRSLLDDPLQVTGSLSGGELSLRIANGFASNMLNKPDILARFREAAEALSGGTPRISVSGMDSAEQIRQRSVDELSRFPGVKFKS